MARPRQIFDERIIEVARQCFLEHGPGVSIHVIAERLGVSEAAIFKRFGSKEALLFAALAPPEKPPWLALVEAGPDERPLKDQVYAITQAVIDYFDSMVPCASTLRASGVSVERLMSCYERPPPVHAHRALTGWLRRAQRRGRIRRCHAEHTATAWLGALHIRPFLSHVAGEHFPSNGQRAYVEQLAELLCRALDPERSA